MDVVRLSPSAARRAVGAVHLSIAAAASTWIATIVTGAAQVGAAVLAGGCTWMAVCAVRQGVTVTPATVVVRGWLWSRRIPRDAITAVTGWPAIRWSSAGRERWTPVHAFYRPGVGPRFSHPDHANLTRLRAQLIPPNSVADR